MMKQSLGEALNEVLQECVQKDARLVVLNCDVAKSVGIREFGQKYPEHFIQLGICEQDMLLMAGGMAASGRIPVATTFAKFGSLRVAEQISTFVAYPGQNVKIVVSHGGISPAQDGVTHQSVEDLGLLRAIPGMTVLEPFDGNSCKELFRQAFAYQGPVYFRMNREKLPVLETEKLELGKGVRVREGGDIAVLAMGSMVSRALEAAEMLRQEKVDAAVYAIHTLKPLDKQLVLSLAERFGALVTAEEHNVNCGLGDAVSGIVTDGCPVPVGKVALEDAFAQTGAYSELLQYYRLTARDIAECVKKTLAKKRKAVSVV